MVAVELHNLGHVEIHRGETDAAEAHFRECAGLSGSDDPYGTAMNRLDEAVVAFARNDLALAKTLLGHAEKALSQAGTEPAMDDQLEIERLRRRLSEGPGS